MRDKKAKNKASKPPTDRAVGTSVLAQPSLSSPASRLSSFSPDGALFAFLSLAVDKHRLRVYDVATGSAVADHTFDAARVTALVWGAFELTDESKASTKRRKRTMFSLDIAARPIFERGAAPRSSDTLLASSDCEDRA